MSGYVVIYTGVFVVYGIMEVLGLMPQEVKSAGVTLTGIFGRFYGDLVSSVVGACSGHCSYFSMPTLATDSSDSHSPDCGGGLVPLFHIDV